MAFARLVLCMTAFLVMFRLFCQVATQHYVRKDHEESSVLGMMLQNHVFRRITGPVPNYVCLQECSADVRCQSFNFVISKEMCELNDRTKEARPEDYVPDSDRFYFGLPRIGGRVPLGSVPEIPAETCHEIKASEGGEAVSRKYWFSSIVPGEVVFAHCNMKTEDVDECSSTIPVCDVTATCKNTIGSYRCTCPEAGFKLHGKACIDVDECAEGLHNCDVNAYCNNTKGSYNCTCKPSYFGNGTTCTSDRGFSASDILGGLDFKKYTEKLISYLDPVLFSSELSQFVRCWHAKTDGSDASTFHSNCDGKGPSVTIIQFGHYVFGGYTNVPWHSGCRWSLASKAFLFSLYNANGYNPVKLAQYRYQHLAMYSCNTRGPTFGGGHDIYISNDSLNNQGSHTECGYTYSVPSGYSVSENCAFFTGGRYFTPTDIEVFYEKDVDECTEGLHDCDLNAYCNNTIGSFTCTCKPTYFGNGKTCTSHRGLGASAILDNLDPKNYSERLMSYLDPVLLSKDRSGFVRCWHAKTDGSAASTFHSNCDGKGPTVTIIKSGNFVFGGYADVSWHIRQSYSSSGKAFLFSLYNAKGYNPVKLTQYRNQQNAILGNSNHGPTFGAGLGHDIYISDNALNNQTSYTKCGATYSVPSGYSAGDCGFFTGNLYFTPTDIEVFYEIGDLGASAILGHLDPKYLGQLLSFLDPVVPDAYRSEFVRCWHAKTDGSTASTFHSNCDGKGPTVTVIKVGDYVFGGYTDVSWFSSPCSYSPASKAFIFSLYNAKGYNPVNLTQYRNQHCAIYSCNTHGPTFGGGFDIHISNDALNNQGSYTECGYTYSVPSGYSVSVNCGFFTGGRHFTPTDIEVFFQIGGLGESDILGDLDPNRYLGKLMSYLDPVLSGASRGDFVRCWHAKTDGSAASTFHSNCDGKGPTVTIIKYNSYIFGGYSDVSWHNNSCGYSSAHKAFLFSLYNAEGYSPVKLAQYRNQQSAVYICSSYLPTFGYGDGHTHDIYIPDNALSNPHTYTRCGSTYSVPSGYSAGDCGFFTGDLYFTPTDIEVFYQIGSLSESVILGDLNHDKYLGKLISYLDPVLPSASLSLARCWHAKTDGSAASTFHSNCDGKGPTVTIIKVGHYIFGAYTDVSWHSSCSWSSASKAFLFSLYNAQGYNPVKLTQYQNQNKAMYICNGYGPTFGNGHDIHISNDALNNKASYTECGYTYSVPSGYSVSDNCGFFTGVGKHFTPTDVEVFYDTGLSASAILSGLDPSKYLNVLMSYLNPVLISSGRSRFVRCWHAKTDGSAAATFHSNCDGKGPTVTLIKAGNYIFGGYTDVSWYSSPCGYSPASKAFIFSLYNAGGYNPVKLTQYRYRHHAMYGCYSYGPTFGTGHDIYISNVALNNQGSYTECGYTYSVPPGYSVSNNCGFFTGGRHFTPTDIEVFYEIGN